MRYRINNTIKTIHTITSPNITTPTVPATLMTITVSAINKINVSISIVSSNILLISFHNIICFLREKKKRAEALSLNFVTIFYFIIIKY